MGIGIEEVARLGTLNKSNHKKIYLSVDLQGDPPVEGLKTKPILSKKESI